MENSYKGLYRDYRVYIGVILGVMESEMETTVVYWGCMGIMEQKMETTM